LTFLLDALPAKILLLASLTLAELGEEICIDLVFLAKGEKLVFVWQWKPLLNRCERWRRLYPLGSWGFRSVVFWFGD
jgi:hypothetical protein